MNKLTMIAAVMTVISVMTGCVTDPLNYPQTERDMKTYTADVEKPVHDGQYKIAIVSRMNKACRVEPFIMKAIAEQTEKAVTENFTGLGWFETIDRQNGVALIQAANCDVNEIDESAFPSADLVLIADSVVYYYRSEGGSSCATAGQARGVKIETDFRLVDVHTKRPVIAKRMSSFGFGGNYVASGPESIQIATKKNAELFAKVVAARFLPGAKVLQTRGNGRFAQIALGKNYLVKDGDQIEFYTVEKLKDGRFNENVFALGSIMGINPDHHLESQKAWVEVRDFETANVLKGNDAKVTEPPEQVEE